MKKIFWPFILLLCFLFQPLSTVRADGVIVPPLPPCYDFECPPLPRPTTQLEIRYHHVTVSIENQLAVTRVDQVFYNPNTWAVEGTYIFPLPADAVVSDFALWVDGKPVAGEVLSAVEARKYYEEVVRSLRDPALLEYIERGAVRASVFPIPPQGEQKIEIEYHQVLTSQNGLVRYTYPLNTEKFSLAPLQDVAVKVEIRDQQAIRAVYSPSHPISVDQRGERYKIAGYEAQNVLPDTDFTLYYSLGESEAFHLFSYRDPSDAQNQDGFFLLLLAPKPGDGNEPVAKDVFLVLDRSGSMEGEKFLQAQSALRYILKKLNPKDRFYLQAFSTGLTTYADELRPASDVNEALAWVDRLSAAGSTDINRALLEVVSVASKERPTYLIFLTDGLPTEGVIDAAEIVNNFARSAPANVRLFSFGVGYDVDTTLLDTLSQEHHGQSAYIRPGESLNEVLSAFYEKISTPVLTNLKLDFGKQVIYDVYPDPLPDLFSGGQIVVTGRYREGGSEDITLTGEVNGQPQKFRFDQQIFANDTRGNESGIEALPRLWATRKIGYLLNQIRLKGANKEIIEQIVQLSIRYGIITPYTSYLVTDPMPLGVEEQSRIAEDQFDQVQAAPMEASGKSAVERASQEGMMQSAEVAPGVMPAQGEGQQTDNAALAIRVVGSRTFLLRGGVWMDTVYDPQKMAVQNIKFLSDDYFKLISVRPDLAPILALGDQVLLVVDGKAFQIVLENKPGAPVILPDAAPDNTERESLSTAQPEHQTPNGNDIELPQDQGAAGSSTCLSIGLAPGVIGLMIVRQISRRKK